MIPVPLITSAISGITGFFTKKQELKKAGVTAKSKLDMARLSGSQTIEMTDAEWESLSLNTQNGSWKDEYVTIIITAPLPLIITGSVLAALGFPSGALIVQGTLDAIESMKELGMDYGFLISAVVMAAIGLKVWRA